MNKVKITRLNQRPDANSLLNKGKYKHNTKKLSLLPKILFLLLVIAFIVFCIIYYSPENNKSSILGISEIIPEITPIKKDKDNESQIEDTAVSDNPQIITININGADCSYKLQNTVDNLELRISKDEQIFWVPISCDLKNIIQVMRLRDDEASSLKKDVNNDKILQNLDGIDTYALIYGDNNQNFPDLLKNLKALAQFSNSQTFYFNTSLAFSQKKIGDTVYYLDGDCQNGGDEPCKLWSIGVFEDNAKLLQKNIAATGKGEVNELKQSFSLNFAKTQDYKDGINFIYIDQISKNIKLIRIRTVNNQFDIINSQTLEPEHPNYSIYYI